MTTLLGAARQAKLTVRPALLAEANAIVKLWHRHHKPVVGHRFSLQVLDGDRVCGVAIVGRPVARGLDLRVVAEVLRVATDGTPNACSALYGAVAKTCREMGFTDVITYTLASEPGTTAKAAGWVDVRKVKGREWNCESRPRLPGLVEDKVCWAAPWSACVRAS